MLGLLAKCVCMQLPDNGPFVLWRLSTTATRILQVFFLNSLHSHFHNTSCLPPKSFAKALFPISFGIYNPPKRTWKQYLCKIFRAKQGISWLMWKKWMRAFVIQTSLGLPNLNMKEKTKWILVLVVKTRHRAYGLFDASHLQFILRAEGIRTVRLTWRTTQTWIHNKTNTIAYWLYFNSFRVVGLVI